MAEFFNPLQRALGVIGQEFPKWWREVNPRTTLRPTLMGGVGGPRANGYEAVSNPDITPADVLETGASIPGGLVTMLAGYSPEAQAGKVGGAKGATGAVDKALKALSPKSSLYGELQYGFGNRIESGADSGVLNRALAAARFGKVTPDDASILLRELGNIADIAKDAGNRKLAQSAEDYAASLRSFLAPPAAAPAARPKKGFDFENPGFDRAKMGRQYPDVGPPEWATDKKTGKAFEQKKLTPEAEAVQRAVGAAQKDIDAGNYTPFFDVSQRSYANPLGYKLQGTTMTDALPKKQATIDKYTAEFDTPEARARLSEAFEKGNADPLARDWYAMGQLEKEFIKELGEEEGRRAFRERFADAMAATTGGANPTDNLRMAYYGNYLRTHGQSIPDRSHQYPYPIGGRYASGNMAMYDKVINEGAGLTAAGQPKRHNFSANFMGYRDRATIDEQMSGGFRPGLAAPPGDSYGVFEGVVARLAKDYGVDPANFQDVAWAGLKGTQGKPMIQHVNEAIERTSRVTGKSPEDVLRDSLIHARSPLYGAGAGVAVNESLGDDQWSR